jgi:hypothetical protein
MCAVTDIIRDVFGADDDQSESAEIEDLRGSPLRLQVTVLLTDSYFTNTDETIETITSALSNDFDAVEVMDIESTAEDDFDDFEDFDLDDDEDEDDVLVGDTDPSTGIVHYPGVED